MSITHSFPSSIVVLLIISLHLALSSKVTIIENPSDLKETVIHSYSPIEHIRFIPPILPKGPRFITKPCSNMVNCAMAPCSVTKCSAFPDAICTNNYCGGCNAIFTDKNGQRLSDKQCAQNQPDPMPAAYTKPLVFEEISEKPSCPEIGGECSSISMTYCDAEISKTRRCLYDGIDKNGVEIGKCCVRNKNSGCLIDADCCGIHSFCNYGECQHKESKLSVQKSVSSRNVDGIFSNFEMIKDDKGSKYMTVSITSITVFIVISLLVIPIIYYWYYRKCMVRKIKKAVRREVFHGLEISAHSDDEFADTDDDDQCQCQYVD